MSRIRLDGYADSSPGAASAPRPGPAATWSGFYVDREIESAIRRLPPLPTTLGDLVDMLSDPDASIREITARIRTDPSLTTRLLRMSNSAFYGSRSYITDVDRAVIVLGFRTTRNLVAAAAVASHFSSFQDVHSFGPQGMYRHSLAVAVCCQQLALRIQAGGLTPEEFFVAGLLHDIGRIPLTLHYKRHRREFEACAYDLAAQHALERELFNLDHTTVGGMVADHWRLPAIYKDLIVHHHDPQPEADMRLPALVALADRWVNGQGIGRLSPFEVGVDLERLAPVAGVEPSLLDRFAPELRRELDVYLAAM